MSQIKPTIVFFEDERQSIALLNAMLNRHPELTGRYLIFPSWTQFDAWHSKQAERIQIEHLFLDYDLSWGGDMRNGRDVMHLLNHANLLSPNCKIFEISGHMDRYTDGQGMYVGKQPGAVRACIGELVEHYKQEMEGEDLNDNKSLK